MKKLTVSFIALLILSACVKDDDQEPISFGISHLEYFGWTLIDTYVDDPTDQGQKTNYADEVSEFSNLADILVVNPSDDLVDRIQVFNEMGMKAVIHLNELFFELVDSESKSGANYDLRTDYKDRWDEFIDINLSVLNHMMIGAFYIGEEPTWNGISFSELDIISNMLQDQFPAIPTMIIEAHPVLDELQVPETADWIGFDHYFIKDPNNDSEYQQEFQTLKSKISHPSQRVMVIMDSHYIDWAHGDFGNIDLDEMDEVADNYYKLAKSDTSIVGILGYFWPNGFDIEGSIGARGMPSHILDEYKRIGKEITGK